LFAFRIKNKGYLIMKKPMLIMFAAGLFVPALFLTGCNKEQEQQEEYTSLHDAVLYGNLADVKYLVEKGADVNAKNEDSTTPLFSAAGSGDLEVVKYLVEKGADVNAKTTYSQTPLDHANHEKVKEFLSSSGGKSGKDIGKDIK
jgi:ankyrin repeat protein